MSSLQASLPPCCFAEALFVVFRLDSEGAKECRYPSIAAIHFLNLCSSPSHNLGKVPHIAEILFFDYVQFILAETEQRALSTFFHFFPPGPAASLRSDGFFASALRPDDASQNRFSWFSYCIRKVQRNVNMIDLVKRFPTTIWLRNLASIPPRTSPLKFDKSELDSFRCM